MEGQSLAEIHVTPSRMPSLPPCNTPRVARWMGGTSIQTPTNRAIRFPHRGVGDLWPTAVDLRPSVANTPRRRSAQLHVNARHLCPSKAWLAHRSWCALASGHRATRGLRAAGGGHHLARFGAVDTRTARRAGYPSAPEASPSCGYVGRSVSQHGKLQYRPGHHHGSGRNNGRLDQPRRRGAHRHGI